MTTTGNRRPEDLLAQEHRLALPTFDEEDALALGSLAMQRARAIGLPVTIEVRRGGRVAFRAALPGSAPDQDGWVERKARVVEQSGHATLYERVRYEAAWTTYERATGLPESEYAAHGGGFPLTTPDGVLAGMIVVSGLPQVEDHDFVVACLEEHLGLV